MKRGIATTLLLAALAGCGGGGDDSPPPPDDDFEVQAAWSNFLAGAPSSVWTVYGRGSDGHDYSLNLGITPVANASFPVTGEAANRADIDSVLRIDGVLVGTGTSELYYDDALQLFGSRDTFDIVLPPSTSLTCDVATTWSAPPLTAKIGNSGTLATTEIRDGCTPGAALIGSATIRWSLEYRGGVPLFCVNFAEHDDASNTDTLEQDCIETGVDGTLGSRAVVVLRSPGFAVDMFTP